MPQNSSSRGLEYAAAQLILGKNNPSYRPPPGVAAIVLDAQQRPPPEPWRLWILKGGRNSGKTVAGEDYVIGHLREYGPRARVGVMAPTQDDTILTCAEGETGLIRLHKAEFRSYSRSNGEAFHMYGGYVRFLSSHDPGRWNGPQWSLLWVDEAELCNPASLDQADFGLRLGEHPQQVWTTTPKGSRYVKRRQVEQGAILTRATIYGNSHASQEVVEAWEARYRGTSLGRSQLEGIDLEVPEGAIWPMLGEYRERYLKPMPAERQQQADGTWDDGLHFVRAGAGIDWGTSAAHLAAILCASVTKTGEIWVRRAWRSPTGSSKVLIDRVKDDKDKAAVTFAAIDRSQWSLADFVEDAGVTAVKGDRNVDWRAGLVLSALEHGRLFFDSNDPGVMDAYDHLTQYHRDDDGDVVEEDDDDADALCYLIAELEQPTLPFTGVIAGTFTERGEGPPPPLRADELRVGRTPPAATPSGRPGRAVLPPRSR